VIHCRPFRNADPPALSRIWNAEPPVADMIQPLKLLHWDRFVLSKPYFTSSGLLLALRDDRAVGFVHASLQGSLATGNGAADRHGALSMLHVVPDGEDCLIARQLIERGESFLREQGVATVQAGGLDPIDPFYFGLYGAATPGVRVSDTRRLKWFTAAGYQEAKRYQVRQIDLAMFRPPVDRQLMQIRRLYDVSLEYDWPIGSPNEACTVGILDRVRYRAKHQTHGSIDASVTLIDLNAISGIFSPRRYAVERIDAAAAHWESGLVTYLLVDTVRQLQAYGVSSLQAHVDAAATVQQQVLDRLGFRNHDSSVVTLKTL